MPRKDGQPTMAERRDAARREGNRRYVLDGRDLSVIDTDSLTGVRDECDDAQVTALIEAELTRRYRRLGGPA